MLPDSSSTGDGVETTASRSESDGGARGDDGVRIRIDVDSPLGSHLKQLAEPLGAARGAAVLLCLAPGIQVPDVNLNAGTLRLTCDDVGAPQLVSSSN
jgi:hypothetical protein